MEEGYPRMTMAHIYDIIAAGAQLVDKAEEGIEFLCAWLPRARG